jgi:hypothetical protein
MAVFQLGAGITGLVGSSGGTTFKRNKSANVWMNKSRGASRGSNLQNIRLSNNAFIFRSWRSLPEITQDAWNSLAASIKVKDKFGQDVNISGVAFQRKVQLSYALVNANAVDPTEFNTDLAGIVIGSATIDWGSTEFYVDIANIGLFTNVAFMVEFSQRPLNAPQFIRRGVIAVLENDTDQQYNLWSYLLAKYPFLNANYNLRVYAYEINNYGWTGVQQFLNVTSI